MSEQESSPYEQLPRDELIRRIQKLESRVNHLEELVTIDPLTGADNRRGFKDKADHAIQEARRYGTQFSIVHIDLDGFKQLNDAFGHKVGDEALKDITRYLKGKVRKADLVARLGGDEFAVLMPYTKKEGASLVMKRIQEGYTEFRGAKLGFSFGVEEFSKDITTWDEMLERADRTMYDQKRKRKGER